MCESDQGYGALGVAHASGSAMPSGRAHQSSHTRIPISDLLCKSDAETIASEAWQEPPYSALPSPEYVRPCLPQDNHSPHQRLHVIHEYDEDRTDKDLIQRQQQYDSSLKAMSGLALTSPSSRPKSFSGNSSSSSSSSSSRNNNDNSGQTSIRYDTQYYSHPTPRSSSYETSPHLPRLLPYERSESRHPFDQTTDEQRGSGLAYPPVDRRDPFASTPLGSTAPPTWHHGPSPQGPGTRSPSQRVLSPPPSSQRPLSTPGFAGPQLPPPQPRITGQRSLSMSDYYQDSCHPYDLEQQDFQLPRRTDRAKSDYALHQQNYGAYLDASPPLVSAPMFSTSRTGHPLDKDDDQEDDEHHDNKDKASSSSSSSAAAAASATTSSPPLPNPSSRYYENAPAQEITPMTTPNHTNSIMTPQPQQYEMPSFAQAPTPRPSMHVDSRRPSQSIILPPPESLHLNTESRRSTRIYGLDAADIPAKSPHTPPVGFQNKFGNDRREDLVISGERSQRSSQSYHPSSDRYPPQPPPPPPPTQDTVPYPYQTPRPSGYQDQESARFSQEHHQYQQRPPYPPTTNHHPHHEWNGHASTVYSSPSPRSYSEMREQERSPVLEIQPPSWYQQYAHGVPPKPQPQHRASYAYGESQSRHNSPASGDWRGSSDHGYSLSSQPPYQHYPQRQSQQQPQQQQQQQQQRQQHLPPQPPLPSREQHYQMSPSHHGSMDSWSGRHSIASESYSSREARAREMGGGSDSISSSSSMNHSGAEYGLFYRGGEYGNMNGNMRPTVGPPSRQSASSSHSVHPFDLAIDSPPPGSNTPPSRTSSLQQQGHLHHPQSQQQPESRLQHSKQQDMTQTLGNSGSNNVGESMTTLGALKSGKRGSQQAPQPDPFVAEEGVKAKRKRANADQLSVLNAAFERSYFPSTEERLRLSKQTKMCPRTVQIWFQNKRQSIKARTEAMDAAVASAAAGRGRRGSHVALGGEKEKGLTNGLPSNGSNGCNGSSIMHGNGVHGSNEGENGHGPSSSSSSSLNRSLLHPDQIRQHHGAKRRNSGPLTPSDAVMASLQIQYDDRSVDYFSRKRRATIARIEQNRQASSSSPPSSQ